MLLNGALDGQKEVFLDLRHTSSDYHKFRIKDVDKACNSPAEHCSYLFDHLDGKHIFFVYCVEDVIKRNVLSVSVFVA